jgi:hypothetical protein
MLKIYKHSPDGEYLESGFADPNPLETEKFLIPANATDIEPPQLSKNEVAIFASGAWTVCPDFRGQTFYSKITGVPVIITGFGAVDSDLTELIPGEYTSWSGSAWVFDSAKALASIREKRNSLLSQSDWTQLNDVDMTDTEKVAWKAYRQALRAFPETCAPGNPVWPTKPD